LADRAMGGKVDRGLLVAEPELDRVVHIGEYEFASGAMRRIAVMEFYPESPRALRAVIEADSAEWSAEGKLILRSVSIEEFDPTGKARQSGPFPTRVLETTLSPERLAVEADTGNTPGPLSYSLPSLREEMAQNPGVPFYTVVFYTRIASFFTPLIFLLVGIPCLVGFERTVDSRFLGALISLVVAAGFYVLSFVFSSLGNTGVLNPILAGWMPTVVGAAAGLWLFESMHT
jgi:lipopolysaccharide export system permease protein